MINWAIGQQHLFGDFITQVNSLELDVNFS